jgi:hypothetical protein
MKIKYIIERFRWLKVLFSPFTPFSIKWYIGKTQVGVPYFLPRKFVPYTKEDALKEATKITQRSGSIYYDKNIKCGGRVLAA